MHKAGRRIKWGYATHVLRDPPSSAAELGERLDESVDPPCANDVVVAEVLEIGNHKKIELPSRRRAALFPGDLIGVVYGHRYATRRWHGIIPAGMGPCHILSVGGVCGEVVDIVADIEDPTSIRPLGYLVDPKFGRVNLCDYGLRPKVCPGPQPTTILVVGSAMDSGKTTAAYSVVHGLTLSGARVCAAKLTGTAASKDIVMMEDAGAIKVLDFTDVGHASTANCSREELENIVTVVRSHLSVLQPEYVVLEVADGLVQRETEILLELLHTHEYIDYTIYACNDSLGVQAGVQQLLQYELNVVAVSGWVACSSLAAREAQPLTDLPVLRPEELSDPRIASLFARHSSERKQQKAAQ